MKLDLPNGYPFPYPKDLTAKQTEDLSNAAAEQEMVIEGAKHLQWLHTVTVEFETDLAYLVARQQTGWTHWDTRALEAPTSSRDGYDHPAVIANGTAYGGFIITNA